jgi:hypothetical protein
MRQQRPPSCRRPSPCWLGLSVTSQQYFSLTTNQPPATSQQYSSLRTNQHQPSATSQPNMLLDFCCVQLHADQIALPSTSADASHIYRASNGLEGMSGWDVVENPSCRHGRGRRSELPSRCTKSSRSPLPGAPTVRW